MFLKKTSTRIAVVYAVLFLITSLGLFAATYFLFSRSLKQRDRDIIDSKFREYTAVLEKGGPDRLHSVVLAPQFSDKARFFVRLTDRTDRGIFFHVPDDIANETDSVGLEKQLASILHWQDWSEVRPNKTPDDVILMRSGLLPSGLRLTVGKSSEENEDQLESFRQSFLTVLIPLAFLSLLIGGWVSSRFLRPVQELTSAMGHILGGNIDARAPVKGNREELDELSKLFNRMLDRIGLLMSTLKETVDNVAHDLRTPLTRLKMAAEVGLQETNSVETTREALVECVEDADSILKMLNAILEVSEAEAGTANLSFQTISAKDLFTEITEFYSMVAEDKQIAIKASLTDNFQVYGDHGKLLQALGNLLDNAIKFSPSDSEIELYAKREGAFDVLAVKDQGPGIPLSEQGKVWTRLYRGEKSRTRPGLGLGLSTVQAIARQHGGEAILDGQSVNGSTLYLKIPHAPSNIATM